MIDLDALMTSLHQQGVYEQGYHAQSVTVSDEIREWFDVVLTPSLRRAAEGGSRWTLLRRDEDKDDNKVPLWSGFNDPAVNRYTLADVNTQARWAVSHGMTLTGYGFVMGTMSGNRWALDFDRGDRLAEVAAKVLADTGIDIMDWPRVRSGRTTSPGYHIHARSDEAIRSTVLARVRSAAGPKVLCEVIGDGKQLVGPGSRHKSGRLYTVDHGDPFDPPVIPAADVARVLDVIRTFDECPPPPKPPRPVKPARTWPVLPSPGTDDGTLSGEEVVERYNAETSIDTALERYGYHAGSGDYYIHPENDSGQSVHLLGDNLAHHFGANDPMGCGETSTPFSLYAHFEHGGNWGLAVKSMAHHYGVAHRPRERTQVEIWWGYASDVVAAGWLDMELEAFLAPRNSDTTYAMAKAVEATIRGEAGRADAPVAIEDEPVVLECFADIKAKPIDWIWPGRLARGKLTLICGDPGKGKSFLSLDVAARLSRGATFADGHQTSPGTTLLITDEDDSADTIKPRFMAMGGDPDKLQKIKNIWLKDKDGKKQEAVFTLQMVKVLESVIRQCPDLQLIVIDPLMSYFGNAKSSDPAQVNALLGPLNEFAAGHRIAVMALVHMNKDSKNSNALYRSMGSISVVGKARLAFLVAPDKDDPNRRVLAQTKANSAAECRSLVYSLERTTVNDGAGDIETAKVVWHGECEVSADDLLAPETEGQKREDAEAFVREYLADGPRKSDDLTTEAKARGMSFATLRRAKETAGVKHTKTGLVGPWLCSLTPKAPRVVAVEDGGSQDW